MDKRVFFNPFRMLGFRPDQKDMNLELLYKKQVSDSSSLEEALLIVISKIIEMTRLLSKCVFSCALTRLDQCANLAEEISQQETTLTLHLVSSDIKGDLLKTLIGFPYRLARIGSILDEIVDCCRRMAGHGIIFGHKAESEIEQIFALLLDIMNNVRDAFKAPSTLLLESIISESMRLNRMIDDFRLAHWERFEEDVLDSESSSAYLAFLNSVSLINEYLSQMCSALLELKSSQSFVVEVPDKQRAGPLGCP